jgi:outer membrane protein assembly factor BamA/autotransporter translocation and assembly factor TamB
LKRSRRAAVLGGIVAAAALGAAALGWFPQAPLRRLLESKLQELVGPGSRVGAVRVVPGRLSAEIRGLVLDGPTYRLQADRVTVALSRRTLLREGLFVDRLEMEGGTILLRTPASPQPPSAPPSGPIVIRGIRIANATVRYESSDVGAVVLRQVDVGGSLGDGALEATAAGGLWQRPQPVALGPLHARLRLSPRLEVQLESLEGGLERSRLRVAGGLGRVGDVRPDLTFTLRADLAEVQDLAGIAPASGIVEGEGRIRGSADALVLDADIQGQRLQAAGWPLERLAAAVKHDVAAGVSTTSARAGLLGGQGQLEARLRGTDVAGRLTLADVDLARLQRQLGRTASVTGTGSAVVRFEGDVKDRLQVDAELNAAARGGEGLTFHTQARARGPVRLPQRQLDLAWTVGVRTQGGPAGPPPSRLTVTGTARGPLPPAVTGRIEGTVAVTGAQGPEPLDIAGDVRTRGDRVLATLRLSGLGGEAEGSLDAQGSRVHALEVRGRSFELARLAKDAGGQAEFQLQARGPVDALSGTGRVSVEKVVWRDVPLGSLAADLEALRGDVEIRASLPELAITTLTRVAAGKRPTAAGTVTLASTPLAPLSALRPPDRPLQGTVSATATFEVPLGTPANATVRAHVESLEARSGEFAARAEGPFSITYERQRIALQDAHLSGPGFELRAAGGMDLETGGPLALEVTGEADLAALPVSADWKAEGRARIDLKVDGTRAAPRVHGSTVLEEAGLATATLPPLRVPAGRIELAGDAIVIPGLRAELADGSLEMSGRVPVAAFWPEARRQRAAVEDDEQAHVELTWSGIQTAALLRYLRPQQEAALEATLDGAMEVEGGLASLDELRGTLRLPATTARMQELALELAPADIHLRDGRVSSEKLELKAAGGTLVVAGGVDLTRRSLDVSGHGTLELHVLSPFLKDEALTGTSQLDLRVSGAFDAPRANGTLAVRDGTLRMRLLPQALTGLSADVAFDETTLRLESATAAFGGGRLSAEGTARLAGTQGLADARLSLRGRDMAVRYPEGMRSRLEADLTLTGRTGAFQLAGEVKALRGLFDLDTALEESLTAPTPESEPSPLLRSIGLDVRVVTETPVLVRNNLARLQAGGRLTVRGDMETPAPIGTLDIEPGGKVLLQGREFAVGSGRLIYSGTWDPELALEATARIADQDPQTGGKRADVNVTVGLEGRMLSPRLTLRSEPVYSRVEIVSLIATGDSQNPNARLAVGGPAAALLAGRLTRSLRGLGLDEVNIQPELVAKEGQVETGARFTFGKRLTSRANLVYSMSLQDPEGRFIQVEGTPRRDLALSVRRTDEGLFTYGAGQRFHFGGGPGTRAETYEQRVRVVEVRMEGDRPLEPADLRSAIKTEAGDRKTAWDLQDDADRLRERLVERGFLEAEVGGRFEGQVAIFTIRSGARYEYAVSGMDGPPDLSGVVRSSLFEEEALERGRARLLKTLRGRGHLRAHVEARAEPVQGGRRLAFRVHPGPVLQADVRFPGAQALSPGRLLEVAGGAGRLMTEPALAIADLLAAYRAAHYLAAEVDLPQVTEGGTPLAIVVPVREGPRARVAAVRIEGATVPQGELMSVAALPTGGVYHEGDVAAAADRLRGQYYGLGYPAVRVTARLEPRGSDLELTFQVTEGERVTVGAVVLRGMRRTRESLVRKQVRLRPGDPLDLRKVAELERRLLDLGLFTRAAATVSDGNPATITVTLEEGDRVRAGYLLSYNNDKGGRAEVDGETRGLFGAGVALGARVSMGKDLRDVRGYVNIPAVLPTGRLTISAFRLAEDLPLSIDEENGETFERVQVGGQVQATRPLGGRWNLLYGYHFKRSTVISPFLNSSRRVAGLDVSLLRDTRDDPLDARRGRFLSLSLEAAPRALGSDFDFVKGLAQFFVSKPFGETWTWAQGYRLGLAHPFHGEPLVSDEGFEAGGANSIRGFGVDEVGPVGYPFGKEAVLVLNQELRYHHPSGLGGVVFWDAGNTFATVGEASLDLRHALGVGLRWSSPVGLLRLDVGWPLSPREGESAYKLFFSFGQAF